MADFTRRGALKLAAMGTAGALLASPSRSAVPRPRRNLIVVLAFGGWDTVAFLDPKPGLDGIYPPPGRLRWFGDIPLWDGVEGTRTEPGRFFEAWGSEVVAVNGIGVRSIAHIDCLRRLLTGTTRRSAPDMGAIVAATHGLECPIPYLLLGDRAFPGDLSTLAGRVGVTGQLVTLTEPEHAYPPLDQLPTRTRAEQDAISEHLQAQAARLRVASHDLSPMDTYLDARARAEALRAASLPLAPGRVSSMAALATFAVDALRDGLTRSVMLDSRLDFDHHVDIVRQGPVLDALFVGLGQLLSQLASTSGEAAGSTLLDETVVAVVSEMSRTPLLNSGDGKDHWPYASAMLLGGGLLGGRVLGGTDDALVGLPVDLSTGAPDSGGRPLDSTAFVAGLLSALGVDPEAWLPGVEPLQLPTGADAGDPQRPESTGEDTGVRDTAPPDERDDTGWYEDHPDSADSASEGGGWVPEDSGDDPDIDDSGLVDSGGGGLEDSGDSGFSVLIRDRPGPAEGLELRREAVRLDRTVRQAVVPGGQPRAARPGGRRVRVPSDAPLIDRLTRE